MLLTLALLTLTAHADQTLVSPDGKLTASIQQEKNGEIYATVANKTGKTLAFLNLLSQDAEHGRTLAKIEWAKDSRFLVLTTESSGGHSPWHDEAFFFAAESATFRSVDDLSGDSVASVDFSLAPGGVLHFQKYDFARGVPVPATVSLVELDRVH